MDKYTFYVRGIHCRSCVMLIESELKHLKNVVAVKADLNRRSLDISGDFGDKNQEEIIIDLNKILSTHGYSLSSERQELNFNWSDFKTAVPISLGFLVLFILLQKIGIVNLISADNIGYGTAFAIGIIASLSTCMAVVGGLVLSLSTNFAKEGSKTRPQALFHIGRLVSFFLLGGLVGAAGSAFQLGSTGTFILSFLVGMVMLILGINLLDIFPWAKKLQPTLPRFVSRNIFELKKVNRTITPLLMGVITFFLPCGFTQSMQIYALSTGSFWTGSLIMISFAMGTLPVLALLSFATLGIHDKIRSGIFFKTAGLVVVLFALYNIINSLVVAGLLPPIFNF